MERFWADLDAPRWVYRLGVLQTVILGLCTGVLTLFALPLGAVAVVILAVLGAVTGLFAWSTWAWRRGRRWAWWVWAVLSGLDVLTGLVQLGAGGSSWSAWYSLAVGGGTLVMLNHPTNRDRQKGPVEPFPVNAHPADASYYS
jgi:hypothetical protein